MKISSFGIIGVVALGLVFVTAASAQNPRRVPPVPNHSSDAEKASMNNGGASGLSAGDREFALSAAKGGMMEVEMGRVAERQGKSAEVKRIGAQMVADHSKANRELMAIAQRKGVRLPASPAAHAPKGNDFDREYLAMMLDDHRKDLGDFKHEAAAGRDPELKAFANRTSKVIKRHLDMVEAASRKTS